MGFVPTAIRATHDGWELCETHSADYLLVEITRGIVVKGRTNLRIQDAVIPTMAQPMANKGITAHYMHKDVDLRTLRKQALLRVSRIEYGPDLFPFGAVSQQCLLRTIFGPPSPSKISATDLQYIRAWFAGSETLPNVKASNMHMRHVSVHELAAMGVDYWIEKAAAPLRWFTHMRRKTGVPPHESMFAGILVWYVSLAADQQILASGTNVWTHCAKNYLDWAKIVKASVSTKLKAVQNNVGIDLTPLFEMEVLVNRGVGSVDWREEKTNRTNLKVATPDQTLLRTALDELFSDLKKLGARPKSCSMRDYWQRRWAWAPTGAYHSQYEADEAFKGTEMGLKNKFYSFCRMPNNYYEVIRARKPEIRAWPSTKYEWGKQRAIYGTDITSYVVTGHAMEGCEEVLKPLFPIGEEAEATAVQRRVGEVLKSGVPYCFDYEDFNSQHSNESMLNVIEAYKMAFSGDLHEEQRANLDWTKTSITNTWIKDRDGEYRSKGTLMSGWRLTTFMNTVLNYAYIKVACGNVLPATIHNGDDVLAAVSKYSQVQVLQREILKINVRFQKTKCAIAGIAEFLRVDHATPDGSQYLPRAVATLVHGQINSPEAWSTAAMMQAFYVRRNECIARGGNENVLRLISDYQEKRLVKQGKIVTDGTSYYDVHVTKGGPINDLKLDSLCYRARKTALKVEGVDSDRTEDDRRPLLPGVVDYTDYVTKAYGLEDYAQEINDGANRAIYAATKAEATGLILSKDEVTTSDLQKANQHKMFAKVAVGMKTNLAKAFGVPIICAEKADATVKMLIAGSKNPLAALRAWF